MAQHHLNDRTNFILKQFGDGESNSKDLRQSQKVKFFSGCKRITQYLE